MAQQKMTVEIQPTPALRSMFAQLIQEAMRSKPSAHQHRASCHGPAGELACGKSDQPAADEWEPVVMALDGDRLLFMDEEGQPHWPLKHNIDAAIAKGWRQAFVKRVRES